MSEQRVNIQYSLPMGDLGPEVERLYAQASEKLNQISNTTANPGIETLTLDMFQYIDKLRLSLAEIDTRLSEINSMINGYVSYQTEQNNPKPKMKTPMVPNFDPDKLDELGVDTDQLACLLYTSPSPRD